MPDHSSLRARGRTAEEAASRLLETGGWKIVCRNFRTSRGEIDIIAERGNLLAFIEVKAA
ncbi:MAG: YraN family protein, partial [Rectinemataceae bacterium]